MKYTLVRGEKSNEIVSEDFGGLRAWVESSEGRRKCGVYLIKTIKKSSESQSPDDTGPKSKVGTLPDTLMAEAKKNDWTVISMKNDWKRIFAW